MHCPELRLLADQFAEGARDRLLVTLIVLEVQFLNAGAARGCRYRLDHLLQLRALQVTVVQAESTQPVLAAEHADEGLDGLVARKARRLP